VKVGILGAGITGLSIGRLLNKQFEVEVLEKDAHCGGIARTKEVSGIAYHVVGGHCFNSKYPEVMDFVFNEILPEEKWHKVKRNSAIRFKDQDIGYPIEFSVGQIYKFNKDLAIKIASDFLGSNDNLTYTNLEEWFRKKFGNTLAEEYFIPYNTKIWNKEPKEMSPSWVEDKLPIPDKYSFFESLIDTAKDQMTHAEFYYPNSNNQNTFINSMAQGLDVKYNTEVYKVSFAAKSKQWVVNNDKYYDILISTLPLNILPTLIENIPDAILEAASKLKYNSVSNVIWESNPTDKTWKYLPGKQTIFHRYIHIGNFCKPSLCYTITESIGRKTFEEMVEDGRKDPLLIKPIDYNISEHAYVVFDENYSVSTSIIKKYMGEIGLSSIGRFGEWQYYNMDICIKSSIELAKKILSGNYMKNLQN
jgi:protoporphyrinogen oxidase